MKIAIIDYGMGNLYSVRNAFKHLGAEADIVTKPQSLFSYDKVVLPGVGAFGDAMFELNKRGFVEAIKKFIALGKPFLGICLGMQLLLDKSEESPGVDGLSVIPGSVKRFSSKLKCPHIGWNEIRLAKGKANIFKGIKGSIYAYFCHSYFVKPKSKSCVMGETDYGIKFASIINQDNVYGVQFHPEKSQEVGLKLLENFLKIC